MPASSYFGPKRAENEPTLAQPVRSRGLRFTHPWCLFHVYLPGSETCSTLASFTQGRRRRLCIICIISTGPPDPATAPGGPGEGGHTRWNPAESVRPLAAGSSSRIPHSSEEHLRMLSRLQQLKFAHRFTTLDVNSSGYLELSDYVTVAHRMCHRSGIGVNSLLGSNLIEAYTRAFSKLARGQNSVDRVRVDLSTFIESIGINLAGHPNSFERDIKPIVELIVDTFDENRDGHLNEQEFRRFLNSYSVSSMDVSAAIQGLGVRHRGISRERFMECSRDFYCGDNPAAPGNWLFGDFCKSLY